MKKIKPGLVLKLVANLLLPWLAYRFALPQWGEVGALYVSAVPPLVWSLAEFVRTRRVDALSALVLFGIALSIITFALDGSPRILQVRESLAAGATGILFLISLLFDKLLIFYLARATVAREQDDGAQPFEGYWRENVTLRASLRLMTLVWDVGLTLETMLRFWFAWNWPIERYLVVSPIIDYVIFYGGLLAWTFWFRGRHRMSAHERSFRRWLARLMCPAISALTLGACVNGSMCPASGTTISFASGISEESVSAISFIGAGAFLPRMMSVRMSRLAYALAGVGS
ncbi:putative membrane protein [Candidatus Burkholderia pumila]|uniref:Membrane protein n=1 Tax=Candidatus Burkholderia pumila TaxID=1090375 RepID=A0ABR5HKJ4_9BURK|nr:putative membrane protein [Candidatus Burkholderia pumila]